MTPSAILEELDKIKLPEPQTQALIEIVDRHRRGVVEHFRHTRDAIDMMIAAFDRPDINLSLLYAGAMFHRRTLDLAEAELIKFGAALNSQGTA